MAGRFTREQMMDMDPLFLRMHLRERVHHTVEHQLYQAIYAGRKLGAGFGSIAREILSVWEARQLPANLPDIQWIYRLMDMADQAMRGERVEVPGGYLPQALSPDELAAWNKLLYGRRSYRHWDERDVPAWIIERILDAGMWAASGCNLEIWRFIVMQDPALLKRFANMEFEVEKVKIVCCMDVRGYDHVQFPPPEKNKLLDVGAAMQNMALAAHALGLGGCWSTFSDEQIRDIHAYFELPDYIQVVTYLSLGWAAEAVMPPARMSYQDAILAWPGRKD